MWRFMATPAWFSPGTVANDYLLKLILLSKLSENSNLAANDFWQVRVNQCLKITEDHVIIAPACLPSPRDKLIDVTS